MSLPTSFFAAWLAQASGSASDVAPGVEAAGKAAATHAAYQPFIFWAYGLACLLIFLFTVASIRQLRRVEDRVRMLEDRVDRDAKGSGTGGSTNRERATEARIGPA